MPRPHPPLGLRSGDETTKMTYNYVRIQVKGLSIDILDSNLVHQAFRVRSYHKALIAANIACTFLEVRNNLTIMIMPDIEDMN